MNEKKKERLKQNIISYYIELIKKKFKGEIDEGDILNYYSRKILPMGSNEEDPNVLWRRKNILSRSEKLNYKENRPRAGYYAMYFRKEFSYGYLSIGFSEYDIVKTVTERLRPSNISYELEEYKQECHSPEIHLLKECIPGEKFDEAQFKFFKENLRPEIGKGKVTPCNARKDLVLLARRKAIKELAIWSGSFDKLQTIKEKYQDCLYLIEMSDGKEYIGFSQEVVQRLKNHNYKSSQEEKNSNLYREFENDTSKIEVFIFLSDEDWGDLEGNEKQLIRFLDPELNAIL